MFICFSQVNGDSPAEASGLHPGDVIVAVNGKDVQHLRHKDAQDVILRSGNTFQLTVARGGLMERTWKPDVTPVGQMPYAPTPQGTTFTKTSLKKQQPYDSHWDVKHNQSAKGFSTVGPGAKMMAATTNIYNNPAGLYSEANLREAIASQSEELANGVKG